MQAIFVALTMILFLAAHECARGEVLCAEVGDGMKG
jgi:hypothetical protein